MGISAPLAIGLNVPRLPARDSFWGYVSLTACNWLSGLFIRWSCWQSKPHPPAAKRRLAMGREPRCPRLAEPHVAALSVSAGQGRGPFTVPIWYQYAPGGEAWVLTEAESRKARLIERAGRFSLMVDRIMPTTRYVSVEGPVTRTVLPEAWLSGRDLAPVHPGYCSRKRGNKRHSPVPGGGACLMAAWSLAWPFGRQNGGGQFDARFQQAP
jgi:hypothetical protein